VLLSRPNGSHISGQWQHENYDVFDDDRDCRVHLPGD